MDPLGSDRITEVPEFQVPLTPAATAARKAAQWIWPRMDVVPWQKSQMILFFFSSRSLGSVFVCLFEKKRKDWGYQTLFEKMIPRLSRGLGFKVIGICIYIRRIYIYICIFQLFHGSYRMVIITTVMTSLDLQTPQVMGMKIPGNQKVTGAPN